MQAMSRTKVLEILIPRVLSSFLPSASYDLPHEPLAVPPKLHHLPRHHIIPLPPLSNLRLKKRLIKRLYPLIICEGRRLEERTTSVGQGEVAEWGVGVDRAGEGGGRVEEGLREAGDGGEVRGGEGEGVEARVVERLVIEVMEGVGSRVGRGFGGDGGGGDEIARLLPAEAVRTTTKGGIRNDAPAEILLLLDPLPFCAPSGPGEILIALHHLLSRARSSTSTRLLPTPIARVLHPTPLRWWRNRIRARLPPASFLRPAPRVLPRSLRPKLSSTEAPRMILPTRTRNRPSYILLGPVPRTPDDLDQEVPSFERAPVEHLDHPLRVVPCSAAIAFGASEGGSSVTKLLRPCEVQSLTSVRTQPIEEKRALIWDEEKERGRHPM